MKKSLLALASLAVCAGAYAEVSITGEITYGYQSSFNGSAPAITGTPMSAPWLATVRDNSRTALGYAQLSGKAGNPVGDSSGFGVDTSVVNFTSTEDLGGGYKVTAKLGFDGVTRAGVSGNDLSLALLTPVGQLKMETYKPEDYLSGTFNVAGAGTGMDGRVIADRDYKDSIGFTTKLGPVYVGYSHYEAGNPAGTTTPSLLGLGVGMAGLPSTIGQRINSYSFTYVEGGLVGNFNYLSYDNRTDGVDISRKDVLRAGVKYESGNWKIGGGVSQGNLMSGATIKEATVSGAYTMGSFTLGAIYAMGQLSGTTATGWVDSALTSAYAGTALAGLAPTVATAIRATEDKLDGNRNGYGLSAAYALSKRTSVLASYRNWVSSPWVADRSSQTWVVLDHNF